MTAPAAWLMTRLGSHGTARPLFTQPQPNAAPRAQQNKRPLSTPLQPFHHPSHTYHPYSSESHLSPHSPTYDVHPNPQIELRGPLPAQLLLRGRAIDPALAQHQSDRAPTPLVEHQSRRGRGCLRVGGEGGEGGEGFGA